mgnify:CR=1 FL=1
MWYALPNVSAQCSVTHFDWTYKAENVLRARNVSLGSLASFWIGEALEKHVDHKYIHSYEMENEKGHLCNAYSFSRVSYLR